MDFLSQHIEALIFCAQKPIKLDDIKSCLSEMFEAEVPEKDVKKAIESILTKYAADTYPFQVTKTGGGYQFLTKPAYQASIGILLKQQSKKRLSTSALETLSIIAYKQPVTKSEIEQIRGVNCDYSVQKLLEKELIEIKGKSEAVGRPLLYGSSDRFMDYFGINDLKDLPSPRDFAVPEEVQNENPSSDPE
ncbi:SMC-Scp complex subunit ScpB [Roseivirga sp.]|uniref:SMC-Scp complex subunit ScpB n=1 Tax=Roseivirga sp. TaxID=1964215 RepID=UPI003B8C3E59